MEAKTIQKYKDKDHPWLMKKARELTNEYVRLRDSFPDWAIYKERYFKCIACGIEKTTRQMQAGHLYSAGKYPLLRFSLNNVNGECKYCNYYSKDHLRQYEKNLILKIGEDKVENLRFLAAQSKQKLHKYDRFTLIETIEERKKGIKSLT